MRELSLGQGYDSIPEMHSAATEGCIHWCFGVVYG